VCFATTRLLDEDEHHAPVEHGLKVWNRSNAQQALSVTRSLIQQHQDRLSLSALTHLKSVVAALDAKVNDPVIQDREEKHL